jgi:REP element-mobilizing transposase RayT
MPKYKNKYRTDSHRLRGWDYSANGIYFITLVTQHRICNLGEIVNQQMQLSDFGKIVDAEWKKSFEIRNELFCNEYIIMPNHLHAIIILKKPDDTID